MNETITARIYCGLTGRKGENVLWLWPTFMNESAKRLPDGFTVYNATSYWRGKPEQTNIVEVVISRDRLPAIERLANLWEDLGNQESVLVTQTPTECHCPVCGVKMYP
jgi:hypothetical protein